MKSTLKAGLLTLSVSFWACTTSTTQPDHGSGEADVLATYDSGLPNDVDAWIEQYVEGVISAQELCAALEPYVENVELGTIASNTGIYVLAGEHTIDSDVVINPSATVILAAGTTLTLNEGVTLENQGRLIALGKESQPVRVTSLTQYETLRLTTGFSAFHYTEFSHGVDLVTVENTEDVPQRFDHCSFEHWQDVALRFVKANGLTVSHSTFGVESDKDAHGECLNGKESSVLIEGCTFGPMTDYADVMDLENCPGDKVPHIVGNTLLGGQDDGIDLDNCDALVVGNLIQDFWPPDPSNPYKGVNGGGITGHNSSPLIVNNIVLRCFHGIGFKNGARPVLLHNTIIDGNIGVSLYRTNTNYDDPHGTLINNIIVGNRAYDSGGIQDLVLHGRWWPSYDQSPGAQATAELSHNLLGMDAGGTTDLIGNMNFVWSNDLPYPAIDSLAVNAGIGLTSIDSAQWNTEFEPVVQTDYAGEVRQLENPTLGALEVSQ